MAFPDILPNPNDKIGTDGQTNVSGQGPGYASVEFSSIFDVTRDRTNSGRLLARASGSHRWEITLNYNPMTKQEFSSIDTFLLKHQSIIPFFVTLPQYDTPGNVTGSVNITGSEVSAGATSFTFSNLNGTPQIGDMFNVVDSGDSNHLKAYKVTGVSGTTLYFSPYLQRAVTPGDTTLTFINPQVKVVQKSPTMSYSLGTNNLYSFSLQLEEVQ